MRIDACKETGTTGGAHRVIAVGIQETHAFRCQPGDMRGPGLRMPPPTLYEIIEIVTYDQQYIGMVWKRIILIPA
jgi:hypothetical protein